MKLYLEPISVDAERGIPRSLRWRRQRHEVREVVDSWISQTRWWSDEEKRVYLRLLTDRGVLEVFRRDREWVLSRIAD